MAPDPQIRSVVEDGMLLLLQAERRGINVEDADRVAILTLKARFESENQTSAIDEQAAALKAIERLATKFQPVSIDGIKATDFATIEGGNPILHFFSCLTFYSLPLGLQRPALAFRVVCWYSILAGIALVATILVIISATGHIANFSLMTSSLQQSKEIDTKIKENTKQISANEAEVNSDPAPTKARLNVLDDDARALHKVGDELTFEYGKAVGVSILAINRMETQNDPVTIIMRWFGLFTIDKLHPPITAVTQGGGGAASAGSIAPDASTQMYVRTVNNLMSMKMGLIALLGFVLPAFAAILGSVAYSLRGIANEILDDTFTGGSQIKYRIRMILAPLCGIVVGLLVTGDAKSVIGLAFDQLSADLLNENVSTSQITTEFTAGFLVGYAIEFFFGLADGAINAVKNRK